MNLALGDGQVDMVAGRQRAEYLGEPPDVKKGHGIMLRRHVSSHPLPDIFYVPEGIVGAARLSGKAAASLKLLQEFQRKPPYLTKARNRQGIPANSRRCGKVRYF
jgi:hypothetical protein